MYPKHFSIAIASSVLVFGVGGASAERSPIYNTACQDEVAGFQQASNAEDVGASRHALLLCLADNAYTEQSQTPAGYDSWPETKHFQLFAQVPEIKVGDTATGSFATQTLRGAETDVAGLATISTGTPSCSCPRPIVTRGTGDQTSPWKAEGVDIYITMNLANVMEASPNDLEEVKGFFDQVHASGAGPLVPNQKVVNAVTRFGDLSEQGWQDVHNPVTPATDGMIGQIGYDWATLLTAQTAGASSLSCGCPEYRVPIKRSGGNGVPSLWDEAGDVYFSVRDVGNAFEAIQMDEINVTQQQGNK